MGEVLAQVCLKNEWDIWQTSEYTKREFEEKFLGFTQAHRMKMKDKDKITHM